MTRLPNPDHPPDCATCLCSGLGPPPAGDRVLLSTRVEHTASALRSLALDSALPVEVVVLAPGLLLLSGTGPDALIAMLVAGLSSTQASEVRCLVVDATDLDDVRVLALAMSAPTLASAGARRHQDDLFTMLADEEAHFRAVYQPIIDLRTGTTYGYEALLRARSPRNDTVLPQELFAAAEATDQTNLLDRIGRTTALRDAQPWLGDERLFINFVSTSIYHPEICLRTTRRAARSAGVDMSQIVFEVTEGHQTDDIAHLEAIFAYYRGLGCKVAIDDLGAGYSSLTLLLRLQPEIVKLDKDVIHALPSAASHAIVAAIVAMTHAYGGLVLAEGVETQAQAATVMALGVDLAQGWLLGRPAEAPTPPERVPTDLAVLAWIRSIAAASSAQAESATPAADRR